MTQTLFPPAFFAELARLRGRMASTAVGERALLQAGTTLPGFERREWQRGDRRGHVDWRATARAGRTMVRQPEREKGGFLCLVLDRSASLSPGTEDRDVAQRRLALALAWLALEQGARILLFPGAEAPVAFSGWARRAAVAHVLEGLPAPGGRDAMPTLLRRPVAGSTLHVLSDPWLPLEAVQAWAGIVPAFQVRRWTTLLLPEERDPPRGRFELQGVEDGRRLLVDLDRGHAEARAGWQAFRRKQVGGLHHLGFPTAEIHCRPAQQDAAGMLRRAHRLGVL